jgi:hypothetical protein
MAFSEHVIQEHHYGPLADLAPWSRSQVTSASRAVSAAPAMSRGVFLA